MAALLQPAFVTGSAGRLFVACFVPPRGARRWLLFVPPFAEEANKSRRMIARLGHALAGQGIGLCLVDPYGTGDSEGDFADARLALWQTDLATVADWLRTEHGCEALWLGGLRLGVAVGLSARAGLGSLRGLVAWQPVAKGSQQLTQFLRLRQAAAVMGGGQETLGAMQQQLADGQPLEVAGYSLHPTLAAALADLDLNALHPDVPAHWFELTRSPDAPLMPASRQVIEAWQVAGSAVHAEGVPGDPFWAVQELVDAPALVDATVARLVAEAQP